MTAIFAKHLVDGKTGCHVKHQGPEKAMDWVEILLLSLCSFIPFGAMLAFGLSVTKAKIRYFHYTNYLKENRLYTSWASKHKYLLLISDLSGVLSLVSFVGFMVVGILYKTEIGFSIARILFISFVLLGFVGMLTASILYYQTPRKFNKPK